MSFMAERPTGALRDEEETTVADDGSVDSTEVPDPDADAPGGWAATHFSAGGGEAQDDAGNLVTVDADGTVQTFMATEVGVAGVAREPIDATSPADPSDELDIDE
jgi:hypothetical protein